MGRNAVDDDSGVAEHAEEKIVSLDVEGVDVSVDETLDDSRGLLVR